MNPITNLLARLRFVSLPGTTMSMVTIDRHLGPSDARAMYETLTRCQQECTRLLQAYRDLKWGGITEHVKAFRQLFGYVIRTVPTVPPEDESRLHLRIIADEFCELLEAHGVTSYREQIMAAIRECRLDVDMIGVADACGDIDYTVEGLRQCYGIPRQGIADEVSRSNLEKEGGEVVDGKQMKPAGWRPPDIEGVLRRAGWNASVETRKPTDDTTQSINVPGPGKPGQAK